MDRWPLSGLRLRSHISVAAQRGRIMFMDVGKPGPPPIAEGAYWLLAPVAVVTATLTFIGWFGLIAEQKLAAWIRSRA